MKFFWTKLKTALEKYKRLAINENDIINVYIRFVAWQVRLCFNKNMKVIKWIDDLKLELFPHMSVVTGNYYLGLLEFQEQAFCMHYLCRNELFYDVGANIGDYAILASGVAGAQVVAIEPILNTVKYMKRNINLNGLENQIKIEISCVGNEEKEVDFICNEDSVNRKINFNRGGDIVGNICKVKQRRLESLFEQYGIPNMIKMDIEGFELEAISSMGDRLKESTINVIIAELSDRQVIAELNKYGFAMYEYNPYERKLYSAKKENANGIFIRNLNLAQERVEAAKAFTVKKYSI